MRLAVIALLALAGCPPAPTVGVDASATAHTSAPPTASAPSPTVSASAPSPQAPATVHECKGDGDCMNSCRHGAVNRRWWEETYPGGEGCEDGCTSKGIEAPRCEQGQCVAYAAGKNAPECTGLDVPVIEKTGPAHVCSQDDDCRMSCRYGAVNALWYSYGAKDECKDGCAQGAKARCEAGHCAAYRGKVLDTQCTLRSIHQER